MRSLVQQHGGEVNGYSDGPGQGSEFVISLPLSAVQNVPEHEPRTLPRMNALTQRRILVVDDNRDAAETLAIMLRLEGGQIEIANDGVTALKLAQGFRPELVLLDIAMPEMDGYEVARRLRAQPDLASTLLVAVTGFGRTVDVRKSMEAGFDRHVTKPLERQVLQDLMMASTHSRTKAPASTAPA